MSRIPDDLLDDILKDPFYRQCCITGKTPPQFHHHLMFGGRQVNEKFAILPVCKDIHDAVTPHNSSGVPFDKELNDRMTWMCLSRATPEQIRRLSRITNYQGLLERLSLRFGNYATKKNEETN